jgi:hypothetical protein
VQWLALPRSGSSKSNSASRLLHLPQLTAQPALGFDGAHGVGLVAVGATQDPLGQPLRQHVLHCLLAFGADGRRRLDFGHGAFLFQAGVQYSQSPTGADGPGVANGTRSPLWAGVDPNRREHWNSLAVHIMPKNLLNMFSRMARIRRLIPAPAIAADGCRAASPGAARTPLSARAARRA